MPATSVPSFSCWPLLLPIRVAMGPLHPAPIVSNEMLGYVLGLFDCIFSRCVSAQLPHGISPAHMTHNEIDSAFSRYVSNFSAVVCPFPASTWCLFRTGSFGLYSSWLSSIPDDVASVAWSIDTVFRISFLYHSSSHRRLDFLTWPGLGLQQLFVWLEHQTLCTSGSHWWAIDVDIFPNSKGQRRIGNFSILPFHSSKLQLVQSLSCIF